MKKKYVLDTHTILWYLEGSPKLTHKVQIILNEIDQGVAHGFIPVIALAEVAYIQRKKGIPLFETIFNFVTSHIHLTICILFFVVLLIRATCNAIDPCLIS